jgi:hypothetical protein
VAKKSHLPLHSNKEIMKKYGYVIIALCLGLFAACGGRNKAAEQKKQQEDLAKEVIAVHDEVMPKMGELMSLKKNVRQTSDSITVKATEGFEQKVGEAAEIITALEAADKGMMDWMHSYNGGQGLYEHDAIMEYLGAEKVKITKVKEDMLSAMDRAKAFLEANP